MSSSDLPLQDKLPAPIVGHPVETIREALGLAPRTMRRAVTSGRIKTIPVGLSITPEEAARVLAKGRRWPGERRHDPATGRFLKEAPR